MASYAKKEVIGVSADSDIAEEEVALPAYGFVTEFACEVYYYSTWGQMYVYLPPICALYGYY